MYKRQQWLGLPQVADDAKSLIAAGIFILISCTDWLDEMCIRDRSERLAAIMREVGVLDA